MSELDPDAWDGVYYDSMTGSFVTVDIDSPDAETVTLSYYGDDASEEVGREEFIDTRDGLFQIPDHVVEDPTEVVEIALNDALDGEGFDKLPLQFAIEQTEVVDTRDE